MKERTFIFLSLVGIIFLLIIPVFSYAQIHKPTDAQKQEMQDAINRGNRYKEEYKKCKEQEAEWAAKGDKELADAWRRAAEAWKGAIEANRGLIITLVETYYGITIPDSVTVGYDPNTRNYGETSGEKDDIKIVLQEETFFDRPGWIASVLWHELKHAQQIKKCLSSNPDYWTNCTALYHETEMDPYVEQESLYDACITSDMSKWLKDLIAARIKHHRDAAIAARLAAYLEWLMSLLRTLPGRILILPFTIYNPHDFTDQMVVNITDGLGWNITPHQIVAEIGPDEELMFEVQVAVPLSAEIGTVNQLNLQGHSLIDPERSATDISFVVVSPTVDVTAGNDTSGLRGQSLDLTFSVKNIGETPDNFHISITNPLGWPLVPSSFDVLLMPAQETTLTSTLTIPTDVPFWTTNGIFFQANSISEPSQSDKDWLAVRINEVDICPLMIESPFGQIPSGTVDTPKVWVNNDGDVESFFDVFLEIDLPTPHRDSLKDIHLAPNELIPIEFAPLSLIGNGTFNVKFYTRVLGGDADPKNDTISASFQLLPPTGNWVKKSDVINQPSGKRVKSGGSIAAYGDYVYLILGNNTRDFLRYSIESNSWVPLESVPAGPNNKKMKKGSTLIAAYAEWVWDWDLHTFKGGTNEFYGYKTEKDGPKTASGWSELPSPNFLKPIKGGFMTGVEYGGQKFIYAGSGSNNNEWKRFNISSNVWETPEPATLPCEKAKIGSGLTYDGTSKIYFLQGGGKKNYFWYLDLSAKTPTWVMTESLPLVATARKKKVKEGGSIEYFNGKVYAVKGGNTKEFWSYEPGKGTWTYLGEVGAGAPTPPAKGIKCGHSLTSNDNGIFCLIGNNTNEFWFYSPPEILSELVKSGVAEEEIKLIKSFGFKVTNPTKGMVKVYYTLPDKGFAHLRIYNILGEIVYSGKTDKGSFTIKNLPAGIYHLRFESASGGYKAERKLVIVK